MGVKFCTMVHISPGAGLLPFWERYHEGILLIRNFWPKFRLFDRECLENGKLQHYITITAYYYLDESFLKM